MKKRFLLALACIMLASAFLFGFSACSERRDSGGAGTPVQMNVKYIDEEHVANEENKQTYYMFTSSSYGSYCYYWDTFTSIRHYTIGFRYKIVGDSMVCFFDSIEYENDHSDVKTNLTDWSMTFSLVDCDVLVSYSDACIYINENYLDEIPNFGK